MKIVTVMPLKKGAAKGDLTYFSAKEITVGSIVTIPLRSNKILGLVVAVEDASGAKGDIKEMSFNLKKILDVKEHSIFREEYLESIFDTSKYFASNKNNTATSLIPVIFREEYDEIAKFVNKQKTERASVLKKNIQTEKLLYQALPEDRISSYKTLIRESFALKKSVFIVLPTEREIKNLYESLSRGIEQFTFYIHSGLSKKKIIDKLGKIINTEHGVLIIGTAPFLSIPREDIGIVILEHESSTGYKTIQKPHLDLRVFTEIYTSKINAKLILSDTLLRFETIARAEKDGFAPLHPLSFRINFEGEIKIENPRPSKDTKVLFKIFSNQTIEDIKNAVERKKNVFVFSLRKGLATMTVCRDCSDTISCEKCGAPLVLYQSEGNEKGKKRMFACNRCQTEKGSDVACKTCGSWNLMPLGIGTDTVIEEIKKELPKIKIYKLDKESAGNRKGADKIVKEFEVNTGAVLVGTEMALFYLNNDIPLSVIASFDSLWSIPNFKMSEKIIQLMLSILRITTNKFIILTKNERDPAILAVQNGNLLSFVREELADRKTLGYPPYKRFIKITHVGDKEERSEARRMLRDLFKEYDPEIFSGFVAKLKGKYITNALLKLEPRKWSLSALSLNGKIDEGLLTKLLSLPYSFGVFVDPEDLL